MVFSVGCGNNNPALNSATDVRIYFWKSGYGVDFMQRIVDEYNKKQSDYKVSLDYAANAATILSTLNLGEANTYDLYFTMVQNDEQLASATDLSDLLDANGYDENVTIRSKYNPALLNSQKEADGRIDTLTFGSGYLGIIYNADILKEYEEEFGLPKTTKELEELTAELLNNDKIEAPWLFYNDATYSGYWNYLATVWAAQYDGTDYYYNNLLQLKDGDKKPDDVLKAKDGRFKAIDAMEKFITPVTVHEEVTSTNFTKVQTLFLQGKSAFLVNGNWLLNENRATANVAMMKMPVISSIVEKLEYRTASNGFMSDSMLSAVIDAVDGGESSYAGVSENDFARIKEARNLMYNNSSMQHVFIPEYSPAKDAAKDFLRYFYSDYGTLAFMETVKLPAMVDLTDESKFDVDSLSNWDKTQFVLNKTVTPLTNLRDKASYYKNTGLDGFCGINYSQKLCASNPKDKWNADECWNELVKKVNSNWSSSWGK